MRLPLFIALVFCSTSVFATGTTWVVPDNADGNLILKSDSEQQKLAFRGQAKIRVWPAKGSPDHPVLGKQTITDQTIVFSPRLPFQQGVSYRFLFESEDSGPSPASQVFVIPAASTPLSEVIKVYPASETIPENLLRFYIYFSQPMARGQVTQHVQLTDHTGNPIAKSFLDLRNELWNADQTRLTMLLDPGRIKRGVGPNLQIGSPLRAGSDIQIVVSKEARDAQGRKIVSDYARRYRIGPAVRSKIDHNNWVIARPKAKTIDRLSVTFASPLDTGMLLRALRITDADNNPVSGHSQAETGGEAWYFKPIRPWRPGEYRLHVLSTLEDVSGNNLVAAFDAQTSMHSIKNPVQVIPILIIDQ